MGIWMTTPLAKSCTPWFSDTDLCLLGNADTGFIPLDHHLVQVQEEVVTLIKAVLGVLHLP